MTRTRHLAIATFALACLPLSAQVIGSDDFEDYGDGPINTLVGGIGWEWNNGAKDQTNSGGVSAWQTNPGAETNQNVVSGALVTGQSAVEGGVIRQFGQDRGNGAYQASGQVFYKVRMTRSASAVGSGLRHVDWGTTKVVFGVPSENAATNTIGIEVQNTTGNSNEDGVTDGTINLIDDTAYTLVCVLDFDNDMLGLFVDRSDGYWSPTGDNNADVVRPFVNWNWASDVGLISEGDTTWDDLVVGNSAVDVGLGGDTDLDALSDVDETQLHLTDPLLGDTDGGGTSDFTEIALGISNPVDNPGDDPASNGDLSLVGLEFFDSYPDGPLDGGADGTGWDYDNAMDVETFIGHSTLKSDWSDNWNSPVIQAGRLSTRDNAIKREFHGGYSNPAAFVGELSGAFRENGSGGLNGSDYLYVKYEVTRSAGASWGGCSIFNFGSEEIFIGVPGAQNEGQFQFGIEESGVDNRVFSGVAPVTDQTYTIVAKLDFYDAVVDLWVNPVLTNTEGNNPALATLSPGFDSMNATGIRLGSGGTGPSSFDKLVVATTWEALNVQPADGDGDGLPGAWEEANDLDDTDDGSTNPHYGADGDPDNDGLTNLAEYNLGTKANSDDSDDDGLTDLTGESAAGTNPLKADTDGDDLKDGDEVTGNNPSSHTSNPLLFDTDSDGQSDGGEVLGDAVGTTSDPDDANDTVGLPFGLVGCDGFSYSDGPITDQTGGEYFDYDNLFANDTFIGHTGTSSAWKGHEDTSTGEAIIVGGVLVTSNDSRATRSFNGPIEGSGENDDARFGAVNEVGEFDASVVYFKAEMTRRAGTTTSYIVSDDFGGWRMAFGAIDISVAEDGSLIEWGIEEFGVDKTTDFGDLAVNDNQTYTVVGKLDFLGDLLSLWVDPDLNDTETANTPLVTREYTADNWSSGVRLNSKGAGTTEWDNVVVAHTWEHLKKVITEPVAIQLIANGYNTGSGKLGLSASGIPAGADFHLRQSTDGTNFTPLPSPFDFDSTTPQPFLIDVNPAADPTLLFQAWEGLSNP